MRVHHLNCGTMHPASQRLINGTGGLFAAATLVCHCLLVETEQSLILIDTGFGTRDAEEPVRSLGENFLRLIRPLLDPRESALSQVIRLGYQPTDVRHIVLTHLDPDHTGGISDFPWATVHLHAREHEAGMLRPTRGERRRYRPNQWAHGPVWSTYDENDGDDWFGFAAVHQLKGLPPEILLIPLAGHSRGHTGVAVDTGARWLLHAGDAYFFRGEIDPARPHCPPGLRMSQNMVQFNGPARHANLTRLRELRASHHDQVDVFCAHDPVELARYDHNPTEDLSCQ
ncbi:Glyoxylase, beta-lactamase superfamily II [Nonomuraea jiangxiensis]|uniref:Glyoxylase, beta-lactamase superfamily II n=2 Tax=Nonomuraea jiangxiensis TaxID=633440 RepID=A0A1G9PNF4_9ACTN|nr:Glyoxylase, beta-lactamase superfamily II [Nonomuraea jiangxiensis]